VSNRCHDVLGSARIGFIFMRKPGGDTAGWADPDLSDKRGIRCHGMSCSVLNGVVGKWT